MAEKMIHIKSSFIFKHKVNGPAQLMGIDSQSLTLVVFAAQPIHIFFGLVRFAQADHSRCPDGPFQMGVADLFVGFSGPLAVGLFFGTDQPGIGAKTLYRGKALGDTVMIEFARRLLIEGRQVILRIGVQDMAHQKAALALHVSAPAQKIPCRSQFGRIRVCDRKIAARDTCRSLPKSISL